MKVYWEPKEDITLYELAQSLRVLLPSTSMSDPTPYYANWAAAVAELPKGARRHFLIEGQL